MPASPEVISANLKAVEKLLEQHTRECADNRKETKQELAVLHKRITEVLTVLNGISLLDQKVNTCSAHVEVLERETRDLDVIREKSIMADKAVKGLATLVLVGVITAVLKLVVV